MNKTFKAHINTLERKHRDLLISKQNGISDIPKLPGIYLFSKGKKHLYVGRTNNLKRRHREHLSFSVLDAPFAFKMARKATGNKKATYKEKCSTKHLSSQSKFRREIKRAKEKIRKMNYRYVVEKDPIKQTLLEIYVAIALKTPYNDFDTH